MLQLRGLQNDSKHEELQRLREETILQCVSRRSVRVSERVTCFHTQLVQPASRRHWQQCLICPQTEIRLSGCVCIHVITQLRPLSPSSAVYQWLFQLPPQRKGLYVVWESASLPPSSVGKAGRYQQRKFLKFLYSDTGGHSENERVHSRLSTYSHTNSSSGIRGIPLRRYF